MCVAQQSLDHEQVHPFVQQMGRESVTQRMRVNRLGDPGFLCGRLAKFENAARCDGTIRLLAGKEPLDRALPLPVGGKHLSRRLNIINFRAEADACISIDPRDHSSANLIDGLS
jgi:hypothetical protein